jgi:hypothetical protein
MAAPVDAKNIIKIGRDININIEENQLVDSVTAIGGQVTVSGLVENNVVTVGGSVVHTGSAVVRGNVFLSAGLSCRETASMYGDVIEVNSSNIFDAISSAFYDNTDE